MNTLIYFKENGRLVKFEAEGTWSHKEVMSMLVDQKINVRGAVMLTYHEVQP